MIDDPSPTVAQPRSGHIFWAQLARDRHTQPEPVLGFHTETGNLTPTRSGDPSLPLPLGNVLRSSLAFALGLVDRGRLQLYHANRSVILVSSAINFFEGDGVDKFIANIIGFYRLSFGQNGILKRLPRTTLSSSRIRGFRRTTE